MTLKTSGPGIVYQTFQQTQNIWQSPISVSVPVSGYWKSTEGFNTPSFQKLKREKRLLPFTTFVQTEYTLARSGSYSYGHTQNGHWCTFPGPMGHLGWAPTEQQIASVVAKVNTTALLQAAVANLNAEFDALTFLVELKQVPGLLLGVLGRILDLKNSFKKRTGILDIGNAWLEVRYGWRPLLNDLESIANLINEAAEKKGEFVKRRTSSVVSESLSTTSYRPWSGGYTTCLETSTLESTISVSGIARVVSKIQPPRVLVSPLVTAWEIIPLSFVLDWIVGVGRSIAALQATLVHSDLVSGVGMLVDIQTTGSASWAASVGYASCSHSSNYRETRVTRVPQTVSFTPQVKLSLDVTRILDLFFLLIQRITRG